MITTYVQKYISTYTYVHMYKYIHSANNGLFCVEILRETSQHLHMSQGRLFFTYFYSRVVQSTRQRFPSHFSPKQGCASYDHICCGIS